LGRQFFTGDSNPEQLGQKLKIVILTSQEKNCIGGELTETVGCSDL
jgi:hypothetical protein